MESILFEIAELTPAQKKRIQDYHDKAMQVNALAWGLIGAVVTAVIIA